MCEALNDPRPDYVPAGERKDVIQCWIMDFIPYLEGTQNSTDEQLTLYGTPTNRKPAYTLEEVTTGATREGGEFLGNLTDFLKTTKGSAYTNLVGLREENGQKTLKFFKVTVKANVLPYGPAKMKEPTYEKFTKFYEEQKEKAPASMNTFTHASIMWKDMPTE